MKWKEKTKKTNFFIAGFFVGIVGTIAFSIKGWNNGDKKRNY